MAGGRIMAVTGGRLRLRDVISDHNNAAYKEAADRGGAIACTERRSRQSIICSLHSNICQSPPIEMHEVALKP